MANPFYGELDHETIGNGKAIQFGEGGFCILPEDDGLESVVRLLGRAHTALLDAYTVTPEDLGADSDIRDRILFESDSVMRLLSHVGQILQDAQEISASRGREVAEHD
jgi:hypothetical protein